MAASGGAARGSGGDRVRAALAGGDGGASQPAVQDLVNAILQLGHLPIQSSRSSAEEKRLAAGLIRARKAGTLSWQQEAHLRALQPATRVDPEDSGASAGASRQAQGRASAVRVDAGGGASQPAAAGSGASQPAAAAGAGEAGAEGTPVGRRQPAAAGSGASQPAEAAGAREAGAEGTPVGRKQFSPEEKAELKALAKQKAEQKADLQRRQKTEELLQQVRDLGRYPKESAERSLAERQLAEKLRRARKAKQFSPEEEVELQALQVEEAEQKTEVLLQQVRDLGRYPKENAGRSLAERQLAEKIRRARKTKQCSPEQEAELQALQQAESDTRAAARIAEAEEPPNPMEGFAQEAQSRIDQDLLMLESGIRTKVLLRRLAAYKSLVSSLSAQHEEFAQRYAERVRQASAAPAGKSRYVPGSEVEGDRLRVFSEQPVITGPLVCQLCESDFVTEEDLARHKQQGHAGEKEYRKRVLFLMEEAGCRPITGQEKRLMVQNLPDAGDDWLASGAPQPAAEDARPC